MGQRGGGGMSLTFFGGVGEVGGNKVLLECEGYRILLDFGMSFSEKRKFYSEPWLSPRAWEDLAGLGIVPEIEGAYRFQAEEAKPLDAVFISHSHADHSGCLSLLRRDVPVYCGETAKAILEALAEVRPKGLENDLEGLSLNAFRTGSRVRVGPVHVEPIHVDHSVPGSYGFLIGAPNGSLVYTGDYRLHGNKPEMTIEFMERASALDPEAMITEGTNALDGEVMGELDVREKLNRIVLGSKGLVLADFSMADLDRLNTFLEVAEGSGRRMAIPMRQAHLLRALRSDRGLRPPDPEADDRILVYKRSKRSYYEWEEALLDRCRTIGAEDVKRSQDKLILACPFQDLREIIRIGPGPGSCYILSTSEPFNEEMELEREKLVNWLDHFGVPMYRVHCSGHAMPNEIRRSVEEVGPRRVYPIHTEHPGLLAKFLSGIAEAKVPEVGKAEEI
ncbi:MAG: MBL fold metallo-hydrolase [Candidatus Bathyarchaeia archaeon]